MCVYVCDSIDIGVCVNVGVNVDKGMQVGAASIIDLQLWVLREGLIDSYPIISYHILLCNHNAATIQDEINAEIECK